MNNNNNRKRLIMHYYTYPWLPPVTQELNLGDCGCLVKEFYDICAHYHANVEVLFPESTDRIVLYKDDDKEWVVAQWREEYRYSLYNDALDMVIILAGATERLRGTPPIKRIAHLGQKISFVLES